jgi:hypothetical protein
MVQQQQHMENEHKFTVKRIMGSNVVMQGVPNTVKCLITPLEVHDIKTYDAYVDDVRTTASCPVHDVGCMGHTYTSPRNRVYLIPQCFACLQVC